MMGESGWLRAFTFFKRCQVYDGSQKEYQKEVGGGGDILHNVLDGLALCNSSSVCQDQRDSMHLAQLEYSLDNAEDGVAEDLIASITAKNLRVRNLWVSETDLNLYHLAGF